MPYTCFLRKGALIFLLGMQTMFYPLHARVNYIAIDSLPSRMEAAFINEVEKKTNAISSSLDKKTAKYLLLLKRAENNLRRKLSKSNPELLTKLMKDTVEWQELNSPSHFDILNANTSITYLPHLDSIKTALNFISSISSHARSPQEITKLNASLQSINSLQSRLQHAALISTFIHSRRLKLTALLSANPSIKALKRFRKYDYYYKAQIKEYKTILEDPKKIEGKVLELLSKTKIYKEFFRRNSLLASLFQIPGDGTEMVLISNTGLQTQSQVQLGISQTINFNDRANVTSFSQQVSQARGQLEQWKQKIEELGGDNSEFEMPDFKPNTQKTRSFLKRLEFGTSIQHTRANQWLPTTSDIAVLIGYKINDHAIVALGTSYKMGWGKSIQKISISNQGVGFRGQLDWKLKGNFYMAGGFEKNYFHQFSNLQQLQENWSRWQNSILLGISKKYQFGKKWKGDARVLFDFLYKQHNPNSQPIVFRLGYGL